jgi:hypothetical protein
MQRRHALRRIARRAWPMQIVVMHEP